MALSRIPLPLRPDPRLPARMAIVAHRARCFPALRAIATRRLQVPLVVPHVQRRRGPLPLPSLRSLALVGRLLATRPAPPLAPRLVRAVGWPLLLPPPRGPPVGVGAPYVRCPAHGTIGIGSVTRCLLLLIKLHILLLLRPPPRPPPWHCPRMSRLAPRPRPR